jgi:hypothetical protein
MAEIAGSLGELRLSLEIKRKETGETETVDLVGFINEEDLKKLQESENGSNT